MDSIGVHWTVGGPLDRWVPSQGPADPDLQRLVHAIRHLVPAGDNARVSLVEELVDRDNRQPWSLAVQASVYESLKHPTGAWLSANRAANILGSTSPGWSDPAFMSWLKRLHITSHGYEAEQRP